MKILQQFTKHQTVRGWCDESGITIKHAKKYLHLDYVSSQRYWRRHVEPSFYKLFYHGDSKKVDKVDKKIKETE